MNLVIRDILEVIVEAQNHIGVNTRVVAGCID